MSEAQTNAAQVNAERVRRAYARWEASKGADAEPFIEMLADDVVMRSLLDPPDLHPLAQDRVGKEFARDYLESLALNLEMLAFPTQEVIAQGDTVVWIGSCHWRDPKTGIEARTPKADIWHFRGGEAISVMEMFDTLGFARLNRLI